MLAGLKRRTARRIAYWLAASRAADEKEVWEGGAGRRHARVVLLASTPYGQRVIRWLIRASEFPVPPSPPAV